MWEEYRLGSPPALLCMCSESPWPTGKAGRSPTKATSPTEAAVLILVHNHGDRPPEILDLKVDLSGGPWDRTKHIQTAQAPCPGTPAALQEPV